MMTIEEIRKRTEGMSKKYISQQTNMFYHTVRYALTEGTNPSYDTVKKLSDWLEARY